MRKSNKASNNVMAAITAGVGYFNGLIAAGEENLSNNLKERISGRAYSKEMIETIVAEMGKLILGVPRNSSPPNSLAFCLGSGLWGYPMDNPVDISLMTYLSGSGNFFKGIKLCKYFFRPPRASRYPPSFYLYQIFNFIYHLTGSKGRAPKYFTTGLKNFLKTSLRIADNVNLTRANVIDMLTTLSKYMGCNIVEAYDAYKEEKSKMFGDLDKIKDEIRANRLAIDSYNQEAFYENPKELLGNTLAIIKTVGSILKSKYEVDNDKTTTIVSSKKLTDPTKPTSYDANKVPKRAVAYKVSSGKNITSSVSVSLPTGDKLILPTLRRLVRAAMESKSNLLAKYQYYIINPSTTNKNAVIDEFNNFEAYRFNALTQFRLLKDKELAPDYFVKEVGLSADLWPIANNLGYNMLKIGEGARPLDKIRVITNNILSKISPNKDKFTAADIKFTEALLGSDPDNTVSTILSAATPLTINA